MEANQAELEWLLARQRLESLLAQREWVQESLAILSEPPAVHRLRPSGRRILDQSGSETEVQPLVDLSLSGSDGRVASVTLRLAQEQELEQLRSAGLREGWDYLVHPANPPA